MSSFTPKTHVEKYTPERKEEIIAKAENQINRSGRRIAEELYEYYTCV
jgi:hypothetical protein